MGQYDCADVTDDILHKIPSDSICRPRYKGGVSVKTQIQRTERLEETTRQAIQVRANARTVVETVNKVKFVF